MAANMAKNNRPSGFVVSMVAPGTSQYLQADIPRLQLFDQADKIEQRPPEAVQLPDRQHVARLAGIERGGQTLPVRPGARGGIVKHFVAPFRLQGVELQGKVLVIRGHAGIADSHARIFARPFRRCEGFYLQWLTEPKKAPERVPF